MHDSSKGAVPPPPPPIPIPRGQFPDRRRPPRQLELDLEGAGYREVWREGRRPLSSSPLQVYMALLQGGELLRDIADHRVWPKGVGRDLRQVARILARHYPGGTELRGIVERGMGYVPPKATGTIPEPPRKPHS